MQLSVQAEEVCFVYQRCLLLNKVEIKFQQYDKPGLTVMPIIGFTL